MSDPKYPDLWATAEWVPVSEQMPEPGRHVLCFGRSSHGIPRTLRAIYAAEKTLEQHLDCDGGVYDEETDTYWVEPGWYETNEYEDIHWRIGHEVTHWMPLPDPPEGAVVL